MMAQEGADIITLDLCGQIASVAYPLATKEDLDETVRLVEAAGRRIVARVADIRDYGQVEEVLAEGVAELGRLDFVLANAGILPIIGPGGQENQAFYDAIDVMLTGVFHACEAAIPHLIANEDGGAIVITSSTAGLKALNGGQRVGRGSLGYTAAKHGVIGLMRAYALSLAPHNIRCNTVHPTGVKSPMIDNKEFEKYVNRNPGETGAWTHPLPLNSLDVSDVSKAIMFLCSDDAKYVTGVTFPVDAGMTIK
jgi:SDR family mycofactocin-dependent oxidoreductase